MIDELIKQKIDAVVSAFETSSKKPRYDVLVILPDGPSQQLQVTYGKHQTTEYSNLKTLISDYIAAGGKYANDLEHYIPLLGRLPMHSNQTFIQLLKDAGKTDPIMARVQDSFFDRLYFKPAFKFFETNNFTLNLSMLTIYDSYIHSGGIPIWLRVKFPEKTPVNGGDEKEWIAAYVNQRDKYLENNARAVLRSADYRTDCLLEQIENNNWDLSQPVIIKFNAPKIPKMWITIN